MNILMVGDVYGEPGRQAITKLVPRLRQEHAIDFCVVNVENAAGGFGHVTVKTGPHKIAVLNLMGRVFMLPIDCPFRKADEIVPELRKETPIVLVDMHCEATSESLAMGWFLDGRVSAVVGTHRHVQTADERVLPGGTAYITDLGLTGPTDGVIGVDRDQIIQRFLNQMPIRFETAKGPAALQGVVIAVEPETGRATSIRRLRVPV